MIGIILIMYGAGGSCIRDSKTGAVWIVVRVYGYSIDDSEFASYFFPVPKRSLSVRSAATVYLA